MRERRSQSGHYSWDAAKAFQMRLVQNCRQCIRHSLWVFSCGFNCFILVFIWKLVQLPALNSTKPNTGSGVLNTQKTRCFKYFTFKICAEWTTMKWSICLSCRKFQQRYKVLRKPDRQDSETGFYVEFNCAAFCGCQTFRKILCVRT